MNHDATHCKDFCISRADAIEAVMAEGRKVYTSEYANAERIIYEADAVEALAMLPSAEAVGVCKAHEEEHLNIVNRIKELQYAIAKTQTVIGKMVESADATQGEWIPCSERLPNESGEYLATIPLDADETYTEVLTFHKGRFYEDDDEWGATYHDDVLAWMPLPTPYKGGDDE